MKKQVKDYEWVHNKDYKIDNSPENLQTVNEMLNDRGCGMCIAKFKQGTIHLGTGMTHACHHPVPHKIPLDEIQANPAALFNTQHLKTARKEMLNNQKPSECDYCWRVEDRHSLSDRQSKSIEPWALKHFDAITEYTGDEDIYPSYLEVSFSNACNLKCTYCGPEFSSTWVEDLNHHGPLKVLEETAGEDWVQGWQDLDSLQYKNKEFNPYIDAFWKWFPEACKHLSHYRITGGEPLMSKETFKSMDWLIANPNPELEFSINSNFSVPEKVWDLFIDKLNQLKTGKKVKKITIYTSAEAWEERAEYARTGLNFKLFKQRTEQLADIGNVRVVVMATFNIFSVTSFKSMLEWILELKTLHNPSNAINQMEINGFVVTERGIPSDARAKKNPDHSITVGIDIPYLRHPELLDVQFCSHELVEEYLLPLLAYMSANQTCDIWEPHKGFEPYEIEKLKRIVVNRIYYNPKISPPNLKKGEYDAKTDHRDAVNMNRAKFYDFVNKHDERNGTSFLTTFPEMTAHYNLCKEEYATYYEKD